MTFDGTDFKINEPSPFDKKLVLSLDEFKSIPMDPVEDDLIDQKQGYGIARKLLNHTSRE